MKKKENQRIMLTKRLLKESFVDLLMQKDIRKISIRELCEKAGVNHCTFYNHYGSQYDLLAEMEQDLQKSIETTLANTQEDEQLAALLSYLQDNIKITKLLINNNLDPGYPERLFSMPFIQHLFADKFGTLSESKNYEYISNFIFYGTFRVAQMWINKSDRESPQEMAQLFLSLLGTK